MSVAPLPEPHVLTPLAQGPGEARLTWRERARLVVASKTFVAGAVIVGFWAFCAAFGEAVAPKDAFREDLLRSFSAPSGESWFGTDRIGRDVFARVLAGARDILIVALLATALGTALGTAIGLATGYFRGLVDDVLMRFVDALIALPVVILGLLALVALGSSRLTVIGVIGVVFAPLVARTVRAAVLSERELDYVQAARLRNERAPYIMFGEILPNVAAPILVEFTLRLGYAVFAVATLSFLGVGIQAPAPDWGVQIFEHYGLISAGYWWPVLFPALAISSLVVGVNMIADGLARAFEE
jgi:peptide/nickel transport system permease protein